jgi:AraC family transcriptional regulator
MPESSGYGEEFGRRLRARPTAFLSRSLRSTSIAVTEIRNSEPQRGLSSSLVREDAFLVALQLVDYPVHEFWEDGRPAEVSALKAGCTTLYDLKRDPVFNINSPIHCVHFYFPRAALNAIADNAETARIEELRYQPGAGVDDPVMRGLTQSLLPAFENPEQTSRLFVEHVTLAVGTHAASAYGGMKAMRKPVRGGLAAWQERRVKEMLAENLDGDVSLADLAKECRLSTAHFSRAFRQSLGMSPHQWLIERRVVTAKELLRSGKISLSDVALTCGFADQSHFTRVFTRCAGISPGAYRRALVT